MALSKLSADAQGVILGQLCNALEPRLAVYLSSTSHELRLLLTPALVQQLRADYEAAKALCWKAGMRSCKDVREAKRVVWCGIPLLSATEMATLGTLGSVLPALEELCLENATADPDGVQRLAAGLGAGALPALTYLGLGMHVGDAGASALAAALGRGAMPQLKKLALPNCGLSDTGLIALVPGLWARPELVFLNFARNQIGDRSIAALVAPPPPPPAGARGVLSSLTTLNLDSTEITDVGCAALAAALDRDRLSALETLRIIGIPASLHSTNATLQSVLNQLATLARGGEGSTVVARRVISAT